MWVVCVYKFGSETPDKIVGMFASDTAAEEWKNEFNELAEKNYDVAGCHPTADVEPVVFGRSLSPAQAVELYRDKPD